VVEGEFGENCACWLAMHEELHMNSDGGHGRILSEEADIKRLIGFPPQSIVHF